MIRYDSYMGNKHKIKFTDIKESIFVYQPELQTYLFYVKNELKKVDYFVKLDLFFIRAFGEVYKKNETYRIEEKIIRREAIISLFQNSWEEAKANIFGEIKILENCHSKNIVQIYNYKINEDSIVIQMEYCDKTLSQYRVEKGGKLNLSEIKEIFFN